MMLFDANSDGNPLASIKGYKRAIEGISVPPASKA